MAILAMAIHSDFEDVQLAMMIQRGELGEGVTGTKKGSMSCRSKTAAEGNLMVTLWLCQNSY